jgi:hypothetical protein
MTLNSSEHIKPIVCCLLSGGGINAFRMASSNLSRAEKSCACAYMTFLAGIFSWYADNIYPVNYMPVLLQLKYVRFQVLTAAIVKIRALWDVAPCSPVGVHRRLIGGYSSHGDGGSTHPRNVGVLQRDYTALHPRTLQISDKVLECLLLLVARLLPSV